MKILLAVLLVLPAVLCRRSFPVRTDLEVEDLFQQSNRGLEWDKTNYLVDEAGPYAVCENVDLSGKLDVVQKPEYIEKFGSSRVGGLISSTTTTGVTHSGASRDIKTIVNEWVNRFPYREQISGGSKFGCAVEPGCKHNFRRDRNGREIYDESTIVVCLFNPDSGRGGSGGRSAEIRDNRRTETLPDPRGRRIDDRRTDDRRIDDRRTDDRRTDDTRRPEDTRATAEKQEWKWDEATKKWVFGG